VQSSSYAMPQQLIPHINHALVAKPHPHMYLMHKFWARKPYNVVSEYIKHYSKLGNTTLDPFCGSGVTAIESLRLRRKTIAIDIDPISTFITRMSIVSVDLTEYKKTFHELREKVRSKLDELYATTCPKCGKKATAICTRWHDNDAFEIRNLFCPICGMVRDKKLDSKDKEMLRQLDKKPIPFWYPTDKLQYPNGRAFKEGTHINGLDTVSSLFTHRNLFALSILYNEIELIQNEIIQDLMKFTFSSMIAQATKMMLWSSTSRPSWKVHRYWVPHDNVELNVWDRFENRYLEVFEGKKELQEAVGDFNVEGQTFHDLNDGKTFVVASQSALNLKGKPALIPTNSIDYVFTDPPYGGSVQYMELSTLWASWLKGKSNDSRFQMNYDEEVTINEAQGKNFDFYHKMLKASFEEVYRVLKPNSWLTVTFHNTKIRIYNSIIKAIVLAGFDLEKIVYQPPAKKGAKQQLQPYGSAIGDYYIRFKKPATRIGLSTDAEIAKDRYERIIVDAVKKLIAMRGEPTPYTLIINSYANIYDELKKNGYYLTAPEGIDKVLKKQLNKEFVIVNRKWWFKDPESVPFIERVPLHERVEISVVDVLNRKVKVSYDEILQEIFIKFSNSLTPESQNIMDVLKDFAKKTKDGNWILDPYVRKRFNEHDKIVEMLALIGQKAGYEVHADIRGWRKDVFPQISADNARRVKEIDVVWFNEQEVTHEFEVENTTGIWSAIVRGSSIPSTKVKRFIVIPEERQKNFSDRLNVPALKERVQQEHWRFILYDTLKVFFNRVKRKSQFKIEDFEEISNKPQLPKKVTESLTNFT
jgi:DNA modification methylase